VPNAKREEPARVSFAARDIAACFLEYYFERKVWVFKVLPFCTKLHMNGEPYLVNRKFVKFVK
jgi:hypothetical protein